MKYILALDQGSTHSKAALMDRRGRLIHTESVPLRTFHPKPSWVEHHPREILNSQIRAAEAVIRRSGRQVEGIGGVGLAAQRSTIVVWDKGTGQPVSPAISWQDLRGKAEMNRFSEYRNLIRRKTGLLLSPYYAVLKLRWVLDHVKGIRRKAEGGGVICGTVNTYLLWHLTRGDIHATDPTHGARTLLMNLETLDWDTKLLSLFDIPRAMLPRIQPTVSDFGEVSLAGMKMPVRTCVGDQQSALAGLGAVQTGEGVLNFGTGGFLLVNTGKTLRRLPGLLTSIGWSTSKYKCYAIEGTVNSVGTLFEWLKRIGMIRSVREVDPLVRGACESVYMVPALTGLGAPHWESQISLAILGLETGTRRGDLVRSAVEGVAFLVKDIYDIVQREGNIKLKGIKASGGISQMDILLQIQADLLGIPVERADVMEATLQGAAFLAGLGCGWWKSLSDIPKNKRGKVFQPRISQKERVDLYRGWKKALESARLFGKFKGN